MEILAVTVWFYGIVAIAAVFAVALIVRAVRADDRDVAQFESSAPDATAALL